MRPWIAIVAAAAVIAVLAPSSPAQSLGEVAARTKKKDADKSGKTAKVYTESDLRGRADSGSMSQMEGPVDGATASPAPGAAPAAGAKAAKTEDEERAEKQTDWRERLAHAQSEVTRISAEVDRSQTALNDLSVPLYGGTRSALIARVDEGRRQLVLAQQLVETLQDEGRRARFQ